MKPSYGLTDDEIETMLRTSMESAEEDMRARMLREQQVEADRVVEALDAALAADGDELLDAAERDAIDAARAKLVEMRDGDDEGAIKQAIEALEKVCEDYVARRMNTSIREAMQGHSIDEYETESSTENQG